jgi:CheY-like chemotaxis protein
LLQPQFLLSNPGPPVYLANACVAERTTAAMKTIFIVEDDPVVVHVYRAKFVREGFGVEVAEDGLVAVRMLAAVKPDVVVLDLMLPKLSGVDVLKFIRSSPALKDTPVIILSNAHMSSLAQQAATIGAERAFLKSSCTPGQLVEVINDILSGNTLESDPSKRLAVPTLPTKPQT